MEIRKIQTSPTHFKALNYDALNGCSKDVITAVKSSPALVALGKKYNGSVSVERFGSKTKKNTVYYGLFIRDLMPVNIIKKSINKLKGRVQGNFIKFNSGKTSLSEFTETLMNLDRKYFLK